MRDPKRIDEFCKEIAKYWKRVPDWRFGQLMMNVLGTSKIDPFFLEENQSLKLFDEFFNDKGEKKDEKR